MLGFLAFISSAQANDILLPHFTPDKLSDIQAAEKIETALLKELGDFGISVISPQTLEQEYPKLSTTCAENASCASQMLTRDGATLLLVGKVSSTDDAYNVIIRYYGKNDPTPIEVKARTIEKDGIDAFVTEAAQDASVLFQLIPTLQEKKAEPEKVTVYVPTPVQQPQPVVKKERPKSLDDDSRLKLLPKKLQDDYMSSPLAIDKWLVMRRIRATNVSVEFHMGATYGDVIHSYDTRLGFVEQNGELPTYAIYEHDSFSAGGPGVNIGFAVGFSPLWWLETSIYGGVLIARKELTTGFEKRDMENNLLQEDVVTYDPATSAGGHIEPRLRFFMLPSGPVKPYVMTGATIRIYDGYVTPDKGILNYSNRPGGVHYGAMAGGGIAFDSHSPVSIFIEVPWTYLFNVDTHIKNQVSGALPNHVIENIPEEYAPSNQLLAFKIGMSLRFQ